MSPMFSWGPLKVDLVVGELWLDTYGPGTTGVPRHHKKTTIKQFLHCFVRIKLIKLIQMYNIP